MTNKLRAGYVPDFMRQGVFLFRFGEKREHLDLMRQKGILRWGEPSSYGEPERPTPEYYSSCTLNKNTKASTFIFCCSGFLGENKQHLLDSEVWPPLKHLVEAMCDKSRDFTRPFVMPILDPRRFLCALEWSHKWSLGNLQHHDHNSSSPDFIGHGGEYKFTCGFVDYDNNAPVPEFNIDPKDRDESEFRIMGKAPISFTWNHEIQNWYPIYIPPVLFQKMTDPPVPACKLLDSNWRRGLIERMCIDCPEWPKLPQYEGGYPSYVIKTKSAIRKIPQDMRCSGRLPVNLSGGRI